jgi:hypothetical protein
MGEQRLNGLAIQMPDRIEQELLLAVPLGETLGRQQLAHWLVLYD